MIASKYPIHGFRYFRVLQSTASPLRLCLHASPMGFARIVLIDNQPNERNQEITDKPLAKGTVRLLFQASSRCLLVVARHSILAHGHNSVLLESVGLS